MLKDSWLAPTTTIRGVFSGAKEAVMPKKEEEEKRHNCLLLLPTQKSNQPPKQEGMSQRSGWRERGDQGFGL